MYNTNNKDLFFEIKEASQAELKVKGSRFIATVRKVSDIGETQQILDEIAKTYHDATHNCYAWIVDSGRKRRFRYSDAGEPSHTAGLPIFKAIESHNLSNVIVIVTRYFGGVKLGTGGLIKAYSKTASDALKKSGIVKKYHTETVMFTTSFEFVSLVHNIISSFKAVLKDTSYDKEVTFTVEVRTSKNKEFIRKLKDGTNGQVAFIK
ncbi:MAG: YigZ family protein [candidate division Zixibacteria bacterium]|nr:YigZ family protein [candidate division Zixibacteria bacterium]